MKLHYGKLEKMEMPKDTYVARPVFGSNDKRFDSEMKHRLFMHVTYEHKSEAVK